MRIPAAALVLIVFAPGLSGCLDILQATNVPVATTPILVGDDVWNRDGRYRVVVQEPGHTVEIVARGPGQTLIDAGADEAAIEMSDGTWEITVTIDDKRWRRLFPVRVDGTLPTITGLEVSGSTAGSTYTFGATANIEGGAIIDVLDPAGVSVAQQVPAQIAVSPGRHVFVLRAADAAGNTAAQSVLVRAGTSADLPPGNHSAGIVARYTKEVRLWDLDFSGYLGVQQASAAQPGYLGAGFAITPDQADVKAAVAAATREGMTTGEVAWALFEWLFDNADYDEARLALNNTLFPSETIAAGGGVCRDLAALYVSLLRAASVPARLVSGYLGAPVDGFHAWVEFYGGPPGHDPWVPVDVSPIDGAFEPAVALAAFGILPTGSFPLREIGPAAEQLDWTSAATISWGGREKPDVDFATAHPERWSDHASDLCMNTTTLERVLASAGSCANRFNRRIGDYVQRLEESLDYGVQVIHAEPGTRLDLRLVPPTDTAVAPDRVEWKTYGDGWASRTENGDVVLTKTV